MNDLGYLSSSKVVINLTWKSTPTARSTVVRIMVEATAQSSSRTGVN